MSNGKHDSLSRLLCFFGPGPFLIGYNAGLGSAKTTAGFPLGDVVDVDGR